MRLSNLSFLLLYLFALGSNTADSLHGRTPDVSTEASATTKTYVVYPEDQTNEDMVNKTDGFINNALGSEPYSYRDINNEIQHWTINATDSQIAGIRKGPGVLIAFDFDATSGYNYSRSLDVTTTRNSMYSTGDRNIKRAIHYTPQADPVYELKMISQPTYV